MQSHTATQQQSFHFTRSTRHELQGKVGVVLSNSPTCPYDTEEEPLQEKVNDLKNEASN
jgi:hypothetical protein